MGKSAYKVPPQYSRPSDDPSMVAMAQRALELSQLPCHSDMQYQLQRAAQQQFNMSAQNMLCQNQLQANALMNVPTPLEPPEAHILAYRSRPKWGRRQEIAATVVAFAALLPPILAVPIINRQTRIIAT